MTLTGFVALPENRLALQAVKRLADRLARPHPSQVPVPLVLHGPPGTGKTHLTTGLLARVIERAPTLTARSLAAADLAPTPPGEVGPDSATENAFEGVRGCDLVVVEDLQHLPERSAGPLAQLIDYRAARRQALVVTASQGPGQLGLPQRLASRLAAGLVVRMEPIAAASRLALLTALTERRKLPAAPEVLAWVAEQSPGGARPLIGALTRLEALARTQPGPLTVADVRAAWPDPEADGPDLVRIAERVAGHFRVAGKELCGRGRRPAALWPRQIGMYLARQLTGCSLARIGAYFGGRDHSTVLHACRKVEQALADDPALAGTLRQLQAELA